MSKRFEYFWSYPRRVKIIGVATAALAIIFGSIGPAQQPASITIVPSAKILVGPNLQVDGDPYTPYAEPMLAANPGNPQNLIGASMYLPGDTSGTKIFRSNDGGYSWTAGMAPAATNGGGDVQVAFDSQGNAFFAELGANEAGQNGLYLFRSSDMGRTWEPRAFLRYPRPGGGSGSYDHEQLTIDTGKNSRFRGNMYMTVLYSREVKPQKNQIGLLSSSDGGRTFRGPVPIANGWPFNSPPGAFTDGMLFVPYFVPGTVDSKPGESVERIEFVTSADGGATLSSPHFIAMRYLNGFEEKLGRGDTDLDSDTVPQYAIDRSSGHYKNRVYVVWSDLRYHSSRVLFAYSQNRGKTWSTPRMVVAGAPAGSQYQTEVAVSPTGVLGITWFDTRGVGSQHYNEYFTASLDGGKTFLPAARVSTATSTPRGDGNSAFLSGGSARDGDSLWAFMLSAVNRWPSGGDYMGLSVDSAGIFHPFWIDSRSGTGQLWTAAVQIQTRPSSLPPLKATDITKDVALVFDPATWDPKHHLIRFPVRIHNVSNIPLYPPFTITVLATRLSFDRPQNAVSIENAHNGMQGVGASFTYNHVLNDFQALPPGGITEAQTWNLHLNPFTSQPSISVKVQGFTAESATTPKR